MPVCEFGCGKCGYRFQDLFTVAVSEADCPKCSAKAARIPSRFVGGLAPHARKEDDDARARHRAWLESPETKARIESGELSFESDTRFEREEPAVKIDDADIKFVENVMNAPAHKLPEYGFQLDS